MTTTHAVRGGGVPRPRPSSTSDRQTVRFLTQAQVNRREQAFVTRNGADWTVGENLVGLEVGEIRRARRASSGPEKRLTHEAALTLAGEFVNKNLDLFGLTPDQLEQCRIKISKGDRRFDDEWTVSVVGSFRQPGYEAFPSVESSVYLEIGLNKQGQIYRFENSSGLTPKLSLDTKPNLDPNSPKISQGIVGHELVWRFGYTYAEPYFQTKNLGTITAQDIGTPQTTIAEGKAASGKQYILAYEVPVKKGGMTFTFTVDAGTGELLARPEDTYFEK
jgi:hypothetical protein